MSNQNLTVFEQKDIRTTEFEGETWFSIVDIIEVLTDSPQPRVYWAQVKKKDNQLFPILKQLKIASGKDGKKYLTDCANKAQSRAVQIVDGEFGQSGIG
jgi:DNA-damage-inducible protein D